MVTKDVAELRARIQADIKRLQETDAALAKLDDSGGRGKNATAGKKRVLSAKGRAAISRAAKKRWAAVRAKKKK